METNCGGKVLVGGGFAQAAVLVVVAVAIVGLVVSTRITTTRDLSETASSQVLGDDKSSNEGKSEEKKQENKKNENSGKQTEEKKQEGEKKQGVRTETKETETRTVGGQKVKTKIEDDGTTKLEIEQGKFKVKYVVENGAVRLKVEDESGEEVEVDEKEREAIASGSAEDEVRLRKVADLTNFPLSINADTNELTVTTPAGEKVVTVLPSQAVKNLLSGNIVSRVDEEAGASDSGSIKLEVRDDKLVYRVKGVKSGRLFGLFTIETPTTAFVSADTGEPVAEEKTLLSNIIGLLSF